MTHDTRTVLAILEHALALAHDVIDRGPIVKNDEFFTADLCSLVDVTGHLLRRYREALTAIDNEKIPF